MQTILTLKAIISETYGERTASDKRRKPNSIIASYTDPDGNEYRKKFSAYGKPEVPTKGTHEELNKRREQFSEETSPPTSTEGRKRSNEQEAPHHSNRPQTEL